MVIDGAEFVFKTKAKGIKTFNEHFKFNIKLSLIKNHIL